MVRNIRKEEQFKMLLEKLFLEYRHYDNLISFVQENIDKTDSTLEAQDFAEELSLYETDIEEIFDQDIFNIDKDTLNIRFNVQLLENISIVLEHIKNLEPRQFERLCALYIKFLGTTGNPSVTRHSHDQGIDFIGIVEKKVNSRLFSAKSNTNKFYLIGQAKHYRDEKVAANEIRELAGSIYLLKTRTFALQSDPYPTLAIKSFTPVYVYFITSFYFSEHAKRLCLNSDIVPIDRMLLAITFGLNSDYYNEEHKFCENKFFDALQGIDYF